MSKPTWGDTVRITKNISSEIYLGRIAYVCGITEVKTTEHAKISGCPVGTTAYLIEYEDGSSREVPEDLIELIKEE